MISFILLIAFPVNLQGTFMFISTVVCLVPVVDCSEAIGVVEMTEVKMETFFKYFFFFTFFYIYFF